MGRRGKRQLAVGGDSTGSEHDDLLDTPRGPPLLPGFTDGGTVFTLSAQDAETQLKSAGHDTATSIPWPYRDYYPEGSVGRREAAIGNLDVAETWVPAHELGAAGYTPVGYFITRITKEAVFAKGWEFVSDKDSNEPLAPELNSKLVDLTKRFSLKQPFTTAGELSSRLHRCLLIKWQLSRRGEMARYKVRVAPITDSMIDYDKETGEPVMFRPIVKVGKDYHQFNFTPEQATLVVNNPDPFGNMFEGRSDLLPVYGSLLRKERVAESFAYIMLLRGLGRLIVKIKGARTRDDLRKWVAYYKDMAQQHIIVVNEQFEYEVKDGVSAGYNYAELRDTYISDSSAGSGYTTGAIDGSSQGTLSTSKVEQDRDAERIKSGQEAAEEWMTAFYKVLDPSLVDQHWEYKWAWQIEMDEGEKANVWARDMQTIMDGAMVLPTGMALKKVHVPIDNLTDEQKEMPFAWFLDMLAEQNPYKPELPEEGEGGAPADEQAGKKKQPGDERMVPRQEGSREQATRKVEGKKNLTRDSDAEASDENQSPIDEKLVLMRPPPGWTRIGDTVLPPKDAMTSLLMMASDEHGRAFSRREIKQITKALYGEAIGTPRFERLREKLREEGKL